MEWSKEFRAMKAGDGCPLCLDGRPDRTSHGVRFFAGTCCDAYLTRAAIQPGLAVAIFRGRHVVEPTELSADEAAAYGAEVLTVGRAIECAFTPVKVNYNVLGNEVPHLHTHIIPRYMDDPRPGWPFPFPLADPPPFPEDRFASFLSALADALAAHPWPRVP